MSDDFIHLSLIAPDREFLSQSVEMVVLPAKEGDIGVLKGHVPLITSLQSGVIYSFQNKNVHNRYFLVDGIARITGESCFVMAENFVDVSQFNIEAEKNKEQELIKILESQNEGAPEILVYEEQLKIVQARIRSISSQAYF